MSKLLNMNSEWYPLQVEDGLSSLRKKESFSKELKEYNGKVFFTDLELPKEESFILYRFDNYFVYVHNSVHSDFKKKFEPYIEGIQIKYDNLINICIMVKDAGDDFRDILTRNLPYMDRYTILDTGSTDNTISIIKEVLKNKRGELYQEPFINFRESRNRLLDLAGDHCHFNIMLDDTYVLTGKVREFLDFARGDDNVSSYSLIIDDSNTMYSSNRITKPSHNLRYINLVHEIIQTENNLNVSIPFEWGYIKDVNSEYMINRTKARKQNDIDTLMKMLEKDPKDSRTYYYIADSYIFLKDWENAVSWFKKRVEIGSGYQDEIQDSLYYIAVIKDIYLNHPWEECMEWYLKCYEFDPSRSESLYFIADHYKKVGKKYTAFMYLKKAYELGIPEIKMSIRKNIYNFHIPKDLTELCYEMREYKLGEEAAYKALKWKDNKITRNWLNIFYNINRCVFDNKKVRMNEKKLICFVSPGGWKEWDGETLRTNGLGGSENFSIRYSEYLVEMGYNVVVFCKCKAEKQYKGVIYFPCDLFIQFVSNYIIDICIINRFQEFIPVSCMNNIKTYFILHDIASSDDIITLFPNLAGILCISDWHKEQFLELYPSCKSITEVISYGIETDIYPNIKKQRYNFIYPSFPNRGLLQLLKMWSSIIEKYSEAHLDVFCDTKNEWCQKYWADDIAEVERLLEEHKDTVTNHGWVKGEILREFWAKAHVWFYPCTFKETCCLTSWEAAASKTLVVTNNLAALKSSVGSRGVIIEGDAREELWHNQALEKMFKVLDNGLENEYINKNFEWVKTKNFNIVVNDFVKKYIE